MELKLQPREETPPEADEAARQLCRLLAEGRRGGPTELMVRLERKRLDRDGLCALLDGSRALLARALLSRYGAPPPPEEAELTALLGKRLTNAQIMGTIELLQTYRRQCAYNVGTGHLLGALAVELEGLL